MLDFIWLTIFDRFPVSIVQCRPILRMHTIEEKIVVWLNCRMIEFEELIQGLGPNQTLATQIKTDVSSVKNLEDAKKLVTRYASEVKNTGKKIFDKTRADVSKNLDEIESFIKSTDEFKDLEKNVSAFSTKVKTQINDKLTVIKTRFAETITHKEAEVVAYEALKASLGAKEGLSQTDKDTQIKELDARIELTNYEILALKKASELLNIKVNVTGKVKTYLPRVQAYLARLKTSIDTELAALEKKA